MAVSPIRTLNEGGVGSALFLSQTKSTERGPRVRREKSGPHYSQRCQISKNNVMWCKYHECQSSRKSKSNLEGLGLFRCPGTARASEASDGFLKDGWLSLYSYHNTRQLNAPSLSWGKEIESMEGPWPMLTLSSASLFISSCSLLRMCRFGLFFLAYCCSSITLLSEVSWGSSASLSGLPPGGQELELHDLTLAAHPQPEPGGLMQKQRRWRSPCYPHCSILSRHKAMTSSLHRAKAPWHSAVSAPVQALQES